MFPVGLTLRLLTLKMKNPSLSVHTRFMLRLKTRNVSRANPFVLTTLTLTPGAQPMKSLIFSGLVGISTLVTSAVAISHFTMPSSLPLGMQPASAQKIETKAVPLAARLQGKPTVVKIYADWCPACQRLRPTFTELQREYDGRINFLVFDVTNRNTTEAAQNLARETGLSEFLKNHRTQTSTVAVVNPANGQVLTQFRYNFDRQDYVNGFNRALERVKTVTR
jgi:thiol-disulfide isomerase/thioredoxin